MAHTPRRALLRNDDLHPGLSYPPPPQFYPLQVPAPCPGRSYATANTINTPLSPHLLPALHHGPSYPVASSRPHKTAETPNNASRQSPDLFRMKFLFNFIYLFTIAHINNPDLCTLLYPSPPLSLHPPPPHSFTSLVFQSVV